MNKGMMLLAASVLGIGMAGAIAPAASAATVHRASISCDKPSGAKSNYSWGDGITTVTVYFNNHCSNRVAAGIILEDEDGALSVQCMETNGGTHGNKSFHIGVDHHVARIQKGCKL